MPITHHFAHDATVRFVVVTGDFSRSDIHKYRKELDVRPKSHRITFVDLSAMQSFSLSFEDTFEHADIVSKIERKRFNEIILAPTQLSYGLARMYATGANDRFEVEIFENEVEAKLRLQRLIEQEEEHPDETTTVAEKSQ